MHLESIVCIRVLTFLAQYPMDLILSLYKEHCAIMRFYKPRNSIWNSPVTLPNTFAKFSLPVPAANVPSNCIQRFANAFLAQATKHLTGGSPEVFCMDRI